MRTRLRARFSAVDVTGGHHLTVSSPGRVAESIEETGTRDVTSDKIQCPSRYKASLSTEGFKAFQAYEYTSARPTGDFPCKLRWPCVYAR